MLNALDTLASDTRSAPAAARDGMDADTVVARLRAIAEPTRLRILALLVDVELSVKELTQVLGQSQPRISRHLKLLAEAGLISRFKEGAWVNIRLADARDGGKLAATIIGMIDTRDPLFARDRNRALALLEVRARSAERYFAEQAANWDQIRALHVDEPLVEREMRAALGTGPFRQFLDLGTGTGRVLELFSDRYERGLGIDSNPSMLAYARSRLENARLTHAQVRQGDLFNIGARDGAFDAVVIHQVLHFLADLDAALGEIARVMAPGGRLLVADFAPHDLTFLQEQFAHQRLGIADQTLTDLLRRTGFGDVATRRLEPPDGTGPDALTVTLWMADRVSSADADTTTATDLGDDG
ncbi:MAG: metalloregulator ArsR/SmtB family transcription factor [Pseudomonadota bacterium]